MDTSLVLTVICDDKPGVVESVSEVIARHDGNWVESSMARLAGKFAGILRVTVSEQRAVALTSDLAAMEATGIRVMVENSESLESVPREKRMRLGLVGSDRKGIVHDVSQVLAERGINMEDLRTDCQSAPMSGKALFQANASLTVPPSVDLQELRSALEKIASDLMVDIELEAVE